MSSLRAARRNDGRRWCGYTVAGSSGGTKDELAGYFRLVPSHGLTVVAIRYTLAPEATFSLPVCQTLAALRHLAEHADDLQADAQNLVMAGDSGGSHIVAQTAMVCSDSASVTRLGLQAVSEVRVVGVVLCCGVYDVRRLVPTSSTGRLFVDAAMWSLLGGTGAIATTRRASRRCRWTTT